MPIPTTPASSASLDTPLGPMFAVANDAGLCLLEFTDRASMAAQIKRVQTRLSLRVSPGDHPLLRQTQKELNEYFAGQRTHFSVPLQFAGTDFQCAAWDALLNIPFASTRSYQEQAEVLHNPAAVRAVARANAQNAMAVIVPCHRVIGKNGTLTGYAGGLGRKRALLELELRVAQGQGEGFTLKG